jgi:hypothetical protein
LGRGVESGCQAAIFFIPRLKLRRVGVREGLA